MFLSCSLNRRWKTSKLWNSAVQRWLPLGLQPGTSVFSTTSHLSCQTRKSQVSSSSKGWKAPNWAQESSRRWTFRQKTLEVDFGGLTPSNNNGGSSDHSNWSSLTLKEPSLEGLEIHSLREPCIESNKMDHPNLLERKELINLRLSEPEKSSVIML